MSYLSGRKAALPRVYSDWTGSLVITDSVGTALTITAEEHDSVCSILERAIKRANEQLSGTYTGVVTSDPKIAINCSASMTVSGTGTVFSRLGFTGSTTASKVIAANSQTEFFPSVAATHGANSSAGTMSFSGYDIGQNVGVGCATGGFAPAQTFSSNTATANILVHWYYAHTWLDLFSDDSTSNTPTKVDLWDGDRVIGRFAVMGVSSNRPNRLHYQWNLNLQLAGVANVD